MIKKSFIYGVAVEGDNFTDRVKETNRLKSDFENGQNIVLISPRRIGKTSLIKKVQSLIDTDSTIVVYMDIYDCRNEYEFYNRLASSVLKQTSGRAELILQNIKDFLVRLSPTISFGSDPNNEFSFSLGITPKEYSSEEILQLPELIAKKINKHIVICIDEFQQIGEFADSLSIQKKMRGVWQLQNNVSYCLFGSKKHMLSTMFQNKKMPFYQFGDIIFLQTIPTEDWLPFIKKKFNEKDIQISDEMIRKICSSVDNQSSYVQQLSWNVMLNAEKEVTEETIEIAISDMLSQNSLLFLQQIEGLTSFQMNFIRAVAKGVHSDFTSQNILKTYNLGTKSNIVRIKNALIQKELIDTTAEGVIISDPIFKLWFERAFEL
ncbi:MAG: ATP-binding protein [Bacteroidales bacterium]|nr:ATP-binding protein [Bacteroidales bacterium]